MKLYIKQVTKCEECPHFGMLFRPNHGKDQNREYCEMKMKWFEYKPESIPEWCLLEDVNPRVSCKLPPAYLQA